MKYLYITILIITVFSCKQTNQDNNQKNNESENLSNNESFEENLIRKIEAELNIPATESYTYKIYSEELNGDDSIDYIITVNRLNFALDKAIEKGNIAQRAEMGYTGNYNFFFYLDGESKNMTPSIPVPSSPYSKLEVSFKKIKTEEYKDILIDYRIRNSKFRRYFSVSNKIPLETFQTIIYDGLGTENSIAFHIKYEPGSYSTSKDILIYKAKMKNFTIKEPNDIYFINPEIIPTKELERLWFFNPSKNKYFTMK